MVAAIRRQMGNCSDAMPCGNPLFCWLAYLYFCSIIAVVYTGSLGEDNGPIRVSVTHKVGARTETGKCKQTRVSAFQDTLFKHCSVHRWYWKRTNPLFWYLERPQYSVKIEFLLGFERMHIPGWLSPCRTVDIIRREMISWNYSSKVIEK